MFSSDLIPRCWLTTAAIILCVVSTDVLAAFGGLVPLSWSGSLSYGYGYSDNDGNESETFNYLLGVNATGYVWRPWFATTSAALNIGVSNTETATSSSDSTVGTGSISLGVFPGSRFPFSVSYSRTDSNAESFQEISRVSGETDFTVTRLSLRQSYRPRSYGQLYNAWYYLTEYEGDAFDSESTVYGLDYNLRFSRHSIALSATHSESTSSTNSNEPTADIFSLTHVYTPSIELGVNNLVSYVEADPGTEGGVLSKNSQAFSSFYWRPEHRAVNVSGGVRLSETESEGTVSSVSQSLNTNVGIGYRLTRSLNLSANASLGTTDSNDTQTLTTAQAVNISYLGGNHQISGFSYNWQWNGGATNASTRTELLDDTTTSDQQSYFTGIGHNLGKSWAAGQGSSVGASFSQSASGSKSSELDDPTKSLNHGASLSWNGRSGRGTAYVSGRASDSRSYGERDNVFNDFGMNVIADYTINRLSHVSGNADFSANQSETEDDTGDTTTTGSRIMSGGLAYRHNRPFGVYNLRFTSNLTGSKQIDSDFPSTTLRWESLFRYSLGLLTSSLTFRMTENAGGSVSKSMNFQATRSF